MKHLIMATLSMFSALGALAACDASNTTGGSFGTGGTNASGGSGSSTGGAHTGGSGTAGGSGKGAWQCQQMQSACYCSLYPTATPSDDCTSKPNCCVLYSASDIEIDTCICNDLTGTGETCAQIASQVQGTVAATCPP
jgi:hypothetical protein